MIRKVERVPINLMAALQRGDLKGTNGYQVGITGCQQVVKCDDFDLTKYEPKNYYDQERIDYYLQDLVDGRREFTEQISSEGLDPQIKKWADDSFSIAPKMRSKVSVPDSIPDFDKSDDKDKDDEWPAEFSITLPDSTKLRPPRMVESRFK